MIMKHTTLITIPFFLLFLFFFVLTSQQPVEATTQIQRFVTSNLLKKQWVHLTPHFKIWNGFWVRYNVYAKPTMSSSVLRNFTFTNSSYVTQTNFYSNPKFRPSGSTPMYIYEKNTYDYPRTLPSALYFYGYKFGIGGTRNLVGNDPRTAGIEKLFMHASGVTIARVSITSAYRAGKLSQVTVIRERRRPGRVSRKDVFGSGVKTMRLSGEKVVLKGVWARVHECIDRGYVYTKAYGFYKDFQLVLPSHSKRFAYEMAWGLSVSLPRRIGKNRYAAFYMWTINARKVITGHTAYARNGLFQRDCSSSFYKIST